MSTLKEFIKSLEDVSPNEWLLGLLVSALMALIAALTYDDERVPWMSPLFLGQSCWYLLRSLFPVCAFLRSKCQTAEDSDTETANLDGEGVLEAAEA